MKVATQRDLLGAESASAEGFFESGGSHLTERESEEVAVSAETLEGPGEVCLHGNTDGAAGRDDAEQHAGAMCALGAARAPNRFSHAERARAEQ